MLPMLCNWSDIPVLFCHAAEVLPLHAVYAAGLSPIPIMQTLQRLGTFSMLAKQGCVACHTLTFTIPHDAWV